MNFLAANSFYTGAFTSNRQHAERRLLRARIGCWAHTQRVDMAVALVSADFRNHEWAAYFDDSWKVTPRLTITAGLRWEVAQPMVDASGREASVQLN